MELRVRDPRLLIGADEADDGQCGRKGLAGAGLDFAHGHDEVRKQAATFSHEDRVPSHLVGIRVGLHDLHGQFLDEAAVVRVGELSSHLKLLHGLPILLHAFLNHAGEDGGFDLGDELRAVILLGLVDGGVDLTSLSASPSTLTLMVADKLILLPCGQYFSHSVTQGL
ncbi:hypothetical protein THAOC_33611 [Thalassiosira oceanica]|uniref:Uncharacterized protein n=1 Tax=Thalassiosira oceanica TaxID=159749 RepID=K0R3V4_THAOC|nr:hypothetical protein THAOC_33611 [Thalassiosira oceanica]|eukprot:EJK47653.1 hypothetical protein THAOC_33611 [Thalassiosira oceanica]